jgi:hypothetical protein
MYLFAIVLQPHFEMNSDQHIILKCKNVFSLLYFHYLFIFNNSLDTYILVIHSRTRNLFGHFQLKVSLFICVTKLSIIGKIRALTVIVNR